MSEDNDNRPAPIEMHLMALGASLCGTNDKAAKIVAAAMSHIEELRRQLHEHRQMEINRKIAKARARRPR